MDINKFEQAQILLKKIEAAADIIEALKNLQDDSSTFTTQNSSKLFKGLFNIKTDVYIVLQELLNRYNREFDEL